MKISIPSYVEENTRFPSHAEENGQMNEEELRRTLIVKELEYIKKEIEDEWELNYFPDTDFSKGLKRAIKVIDKHIKENK